MIYVNSVSVYPKRLSLKVGEWYYYTSVEICPTNASCKDIVWSSDNPSVASVNASSGYIYAKSEGTATIYAMATDGSRCSDSISVNVGSGSGNIYVSSVKLDRSKATIEVCETLLLTASVYPENATNRSVTWNTSNASVATVHNGIVYASSKGTATITATAADGSGKSASCVVTVTDEILVTSIQMENSVYNLTLGKSDYIKATIRPQNAANKNIAWSSSDPCVVTVNPSSGLVYARNLGTATISAVAQDGGGAIGSCNVVVSRNNKVSHISLNQSELVLNRGEPYTLEAKVSPANAAVKTIKWRSSNPCVADVNRNSGEVIGIAAGSAKIYAEAQDESGVYAVCTIKVNKAQYIPNKVTVISCYKSGWINSSKIMGEDMAKAFNCGGDYVVETPTTALAFENIWSNAGECIIIHTHGGVDSLNNEDESGTPIIISKNEIADLPRNNNINFIMMTACNTAGEPANDNVAYWLSRKINSNGIVIANTDKVKGGSTKFLGSSENPTWKVYKNGVIQSPISEVTLTMQIAHNIYQSYK